MKIATTIGEMRDYAPSSEKMIKLYKDSGFKYLDYSFYTVLSNDVDGFMTDGWRDGILRAKSEAETLGFKFVQAHAPAGNLIGDKKDATLEATVRSIEACGILGIENMVIHSAFSEDYTYPDGKLDYFKANEPFLSALIPHMEKHGVNILLENTTAKHTNGTFFPITGEDLNDFVAFMNHPMFGACWDVGHANMDGLDHYKEIMTLGKNLKAIHVHDNYGDKDLHIAPLLGTLDFDALMRGLIDSGFEGYFTLESDGFFKHERRVNPSGKTNRLLHPTLEIKKASLSLLYLISKTILEAYDVYEE